MRLSKVAAIINNVAGVKPPAATPSPVPAPAPAVTPSMPIPSQPPNRKQHNVADVPGGSGAAVPPPPGYKIGLDQAYEQGFMDKLSQENIDPAVLESLIKLQTRAEERPMATVGHGAARGLTVGAILGAVLGALGGGLRGAAQPQDKARNALAGAGMGTVAGGLLGAAQGVPAGILARFAAK